MQVALVAPEEIVRLYTALERSERLILSLSNENKALKEKKLYSAKEVADKLGLKACTIIAHIDEFEYVSTGKNKLIKAASVDKWISERTITPRKRN